MWFSIFAAYNLVVRCDGEWTGHDPLGCSPRLSNRRKLVGLAVGVALLVAGNLALYLTALSGRSDRDRALIDFYSTAASFRDRFSPILSLHLPHTVRVPWPLYRPC